MACPDCFRGGKATGDPKGSLTTLHGRTTYIAGPEPTTTSGSTIIYYTDAFGLDLVNNKLLADAYAAATGFRVLVPDLIPGGPMSPAILPMLDTVLTPVAWTNVWGQLTRAAVFARAMTHVLPFFWRAHPSATTSFTPCLDFARAVKQDLPPGAKLGIAGFCWGGYQSLRLSTQPAVAAGSTEPLVNAQFCAHPSGLQLPSDLVKAVTAFKTPVAVANAENDMALPLHKMHESEAALRQRAGAGQGENGFYYEVKTYPGVGHGFAVRAKPGSDAEALGADEAKTQAVEWFKRWL